MKGLPLDKAIVLVGPTGSGKTALSMALAMRCQGEIVSADSRQIYRHLDIGTAKPTPQDCEKVTHHFIDRLDPSEPYSAGRFAREARPVVHDILARRKTPIVVGGSGLYVRALLNGVFEGVSRNPALRRRLWEEVACGEVERLYDRLRTVDPDSAGKIHPTDLQRIIRALEVYETTGRPISVWQRENTIGADFPFSLWGLSWPRERLYERINARVDAMIQAGLIEETNRLITLGYSPTLNSLDTLGYREVFAYLLGELDFEEMVSLIKRHTRQYAKRQLTWFRADPRIRWIPIIGEPDWNSVAKEILTQERLCEDGGEAKRQKSQSKGVSPCIEPTRDGTIG